jgi:hypothetical protein
MDRKITMVGVTLSAMLAVGACAGNDTAGDTATAGGAAGTTAGVGAVTPTPVDSAAMADSIRRDSLRRDSLAKAGKTP